MSAWVALVLSACTGLGCAQQPSAGTSLDPRRLFAPSQHWQAVDALRAVSAAEFEGLSSALRRTYLDSTASSTLHDTGSEAELACSFIERALAGDPRGDYFRWMSQPGTARERILYTGPSHCAEGSVSLLWEREAGHWRLHGLLQGQALYFEAAADGALLLRLSACCADRVDVYRIQRWNTASAREQVGVDVQTLLTRADAGVTRTTTSREALLRRSPERNDVPDEMLSVWAEATVLGNQLDRFEAEASGWVSARTLDAQSGESWCFLSLPRTAEASSTAGVFGVQAGWTECVHLRRSEH